MTDKIFKAIEEFEAMPTHSASNFTAALRVAVEALSGVWGDQFALAEIERILE